MQGQLPCFMNSFKLRYTKLRFTVGLNISLASLVLEYNVLQEKCDSQNQKPVSVIII